ncbi:MAG TPA: right-handed parallel beta-helix repeat-containing protein, partial [Ignavibacteriaceae bacterium]|nr:right-handed parallel beta-helix repeat-containing protein [Ignavibacteriaceae bacterium]
MKPKIFLLSCLSFIIFNFSFIIGTVRYVSKTGSSTPPYTTWETAADSIMECINISVFGDTIYVANGTYKEQVVMIPGLSLIGAGMDSCVIDTRTLIQPDGLTAITMVDSCIVIGFQIILPNDEYSLGFISGSSWSIFERNRIVGGPKGGALISSNIVVRENILDGQYDTGIHISGFSQSYHPIVEENVFFNQSGYSILVLFGTKPTIRNNIIYLDGNFAFGYHGGGSDTARIYSNLIISKN